MPLNHSTRIADKTINSPSAAKAVKTQVEAKQGSLRLAARLEAACAPQQAWRLLTDYNYLSSYMPNIKESRLLDRNGHQARVQQVAATPLLPLRFELILEFNETAPSRLEFRQVAGNLQNFAGYWHLSSYRGGVLIIYQAAGQHHFPVPDMMMNLVLKYQVENMMQALQQELTCYKPPI
jgi:hypothetical protein